MDYQCYILDETASEELKVLVQNHQDALKDHYPKIIALVKLFGAKAATLLNHHIVAGFNFEGEAPKGWKLKDQIYLPRKKDQLDRIAEVNSICPHPFPIFKHLGWQSFLINEQDYHPEIRFLGEIAILSHPVFGSADMNSMELFKTEGLKEVTSNDLLKLRQNHKG